MRIYLASSWKNPAQPLAVALLRAAGHTVYDFRNPEPGNTGFAWRECLPPGEILHTPEIFRTVLRHPIAEEGFRLDMTALNRFDACVLLCPCGNDAHLELGYAVGQGKTTVVVLDRPVRDPGLMYRMVTHVVFSVEEAIRALEPRKPGEPWKSDDPSHFNFAWVGK